MNLENRKSKKELNELKDNIKKVLFFRVCGTGMGAAACLIKDYGLDVFGTDKDYFPPMSDYLEQKSIKKVPFDNIDYQEFDLIVVGNVVAKSSQEARDIEESGVAFCSFPELIGEFILKDKIVVGISGTHGKTTTTYMLIQMLEKLGVKTGYLLGGVIDDRPSSSLGESDYFVIESDEYDTAYFEKTPKFIHYHINHLVLTSLEYDHADIYSSLEEIRSVFKELVLKVKGKVVFNENFKAIDFISDENSYPYGINSSVGPGQIKLKDENVIFELIGEEFRTNVFGEHNILNLSASVVLLKELGFNLEEIKRSCTLMKLVKRRQEYLGEINGVKYFDDFAHHPTAMNLTIDSFKKKFPGNLISIVFEPASSTARSDVFEDDFIDALKKSDRVFIVKPQRKTSAIGAGNLNIQKMMTMIEENSTCAFTGEIGDLEKFIKETKEGLVIFMSNGKLLGIKEKMF